MPPIIRTEYAPIFLTETARDRSKRAVDEDTMMSRGNEDLRRPFLWMNMSTQYSRFLVSCVELLDADVTKLPRDDVS